MTKRKPSRLLGVVVSVTTLIAKDSDVYFKHMNGLTSLCVHVQVYARLFFQMRVLTGPWVVDSIVHLDISNIH